MLSQKSSPQKSYFFRCHGDSKVVTQCEKLLTVTSRVLFSISRQSWRTVWGKLNGGEDQEPLFARMARYDDTRLTPQQVQRAVAILDRWSGAFDDNLVARKLYLWVGLFSGIFSE